MKVQHFKARIELLGINPFVFVPGKLLKEIFRQAGKDKGHILVRGYVNRKRFAAYIDIAASGAGCSDFGCLHRCTLVRACEYRFGFLLLTSTFIFIWARFQAGRTMKSPPLAVPARCAKLNRTMQTVLITGTTSGIGLTIANKLHANGYKVYGTSRNPDQYRDKVKFELLELDVTSGVSIQNCVASFLSRSATIDALINNAGIGVCGSAEETSKELANKQFQTNFWGTVDITKAFLPIMRQQRTGKIITIGSLAGLIGVPFQSYYSASKHALEGFYKSLRFELKPFNIHVSVIEPGFFKTNLNQALEYAEATISDYNSTRDNALKIFSNSIKNAPSPEPVAEIALKILRSKNPRFSYRVGRDAKLLPFLQFMFTSLFEWGAAKKFKT
jgi:short-subunit dehydrogenase